MTPEQQAALDAQIAQEAAEIQNAPKIPVSQLQPMGAGGRCSFCGSLSPNLVLVEVVHGIQRYKGDCCNGTTY